MSNVNNGYASWKDYEESIYDELHEQAEYCEHCLMTRGKYILAGYIKNTDGGVINVCDNCFKEDF